MIAKGDDGGGNLSTACSIGAVADTVAKVDVVAETSGIGGAASKGWSQGEHVVDAGLTAGWQARDVLGDSRQGERADGDHDCGLHLDRLRHDGCLQKLVEVCRMLGSREMVF